MRIVFVVFDGVTQLDFTGPAQILSRLPGADVSVIAKTTSPVETDSGFAILPGGSFEDAPKADLLCIPGGHGVTEALGDEELLSFIAYQAAGAAFVTSVCTGAFLLGAAGLLVGKNATTHWAYTDLLEKVGATYQPGRYVIDGSTVTGGGVTAGIDFAFALVSEIAGAAAAQNLQRALEYNPAPLPPDNHPDGADQPNTKAVEAYYTPHVAAMRAALDRR